MAMRGRSAPTGAHDGGHASILPGAERRRIRVTGTVQGVGFRPFVYRQAVGLGLAGFVRNDSQGVLIEAEGDRQALKELCRIVAETPPPLAVVESVHVTAAEELAGWTEFRIERSGARGMPDVPVTVDAATCDECLAELGDPSNRRYRYPFTNCTDCGPRYTIVTSVPYDRASTTMSAFEMCAACQAEYEDPGSRRFHAQPNACPECGPRVIWCDPAGRRLVDGDEAVGAAVEALLDGKVVAVKGIGGYHLAVDATSDRAVASLRRRKARDDKPFAVMVGGLDQANSLGRLTDPGARELLSPRRPVVLVAKRDGAALANGVAPGLPEVGLLLAYTPLHHLLSIGTARPLVMTSGNLSDDPIAHVESDAFDRLGPLVDGFLTHDRPIHIRCDDSVVRASAAAPQVMRRSRGYAPEPLDLPEPARRQVLAVGAELKSTVSVVRGRSVVPSHHLGDLEHLATYRSFLQATRHLCELFGARPEVVAHDLHPEYLSTKWALDSGLRPWPVQHHHAHVVSCMVEHHRTGRLLGVAFDGLGLGDDGDLWGGEFLVTELSAYERVGHLAKVTMPGGVAAIREPWRMAVAWVQTALGAEEAARVGAQLDSRWPAVAALAARGAGPSTTSAGRLFDAVSALMGLRARVSYEGQAAIELEALARREDRGRSPVYPVEIVEREGTMVLDPSPALAAIRRDLDDGVAAGRVAAGFHEGLGLGVANLASELASRHGLDTVALSGGVFQNVRLTEVVVDHLEARGLEVLTHRVIPPNDGGISVGQAAVAALSGE